MIASSCSSFGKGVLLHFTGSLHLASLPDVVRRFSEFWVLGIFPQEIMRSFEIASQGLKWCVFKSEDARQSPRETLVLV